MHNIETQTPTRDFINCFCAAGIHLEDMARLAGLQLRWFKAEPTPPFLEHLSFSLGNQVFFVRLKDIAGNLETPGNINGLNTISQGCKGHACLLPMRKINNQWKVLGSGWGLRDARTGKPISPEDFITYENIEMTNWELQDFAIQIVKQHLTKSGCKVISSNNNPEVLPSLWFEENNERKWLIVLSSRYPQKLGSPPSHLQNCIQSLRNKGLEGMVVNVGFKGTIPSDDGSYPVYRDQMANVIFDGLVSVEDKLFPQKHAQSTQARETTSEVFELLALTQSLVMPAPWSSSTPGKCLVWDDYFALFQTNVLTTGDLMRSMQGKPLQRELLHDYSLVVFYRRDKCPHGPTARPILIFSLERWDFDAFPPGMPRLGKGTEPFPTLCVYKANGRDNYGTVTRPLNQNDAFEILTEKMRTFLNLKGSPQIIGTINDARGHPLTGWPAPVQEKKNLFSTIKKFFS